MHPTATRFTRPFRSDGRWWKRSFAGLALWLAAAASAPSAEAEPREMATDRPDVTESPVTVERGRWQLELDALALTWQGSGAPGVQAIEGSVLNLKRGLDERTDLQLLWSPLRFERSVGGAGYRAATPWSVGVRLKRNLWGVDGGATAAALMPWVAWDAGQAEDAGEWSAGLTAPLGLELAGGFAAGLMLEGASVAGGGEARTSEWTASATVGHDVRGPLAAYVEWVARSPGEAIGMPSTLLSLGLTLRPNPDVQLDTGLRLGLLRDEGQTMFVGLAARR